MEVFRRYFANVTARRFIILALIGLLLYSIRDMLNLVLLTFLIAYVMNSVQVLVTRRISRFVKVNSKVIIIILYLALVSMIVLALVKYLPKVFMQIQQLTSFLTSLTSEDIPQNDIAQYVFAKMKELNYQSYINHGFEYVLKISNWGTTFVLSTILSLVFIARRIGR